MVCGSCRTFLIAPFLRRIYAVTDTVIAVARPGTADETITNGRAMLAPTTIDFSISKTDTYDNNVAPVARI